MRIAESRRSFVSNDAEDDDTFLTRRSSVYRADLILGEEGCCVTSTGRSARILKASMLANKIAFTTPR